MQKGKLPVIKKEPIGQIKIQSMLKKNSVDPLKSERSIKKEDQDKDKSIEKLMSGIKIVSPNALDLSPGRPSNLFSEDFSGLDLVPLGSRMLQK